MSEETQIRYCISSWRHMNHGATIAACFGSQNVAKVKSLRRSVLICIKNARSAASSMVVTAQEDPSE